MKYNIPIIFSIEEENFDRAVIKALTGILHASMNGIIDCDYMMPAITVSDDTLKFEFKIQGELPQHETAR